LRIKPTTATQQTRTSTLKEDDVNVPCVMVITSVPLLKEAVAAIGVAWPATLREADILRTLPSSARATFAHNLLISKTNTLTCT
jgi:hypothetical protein